MPPLLLAFATMFPLMATAPDPGCSSRPNIHRGFDVRCGNQLVTTRRNIFGGQDYSNGLHMRPNIRGGMDYSNGLSSRPNIRDALDFSDGTQTRPNIVGGYDTDRGLSCRRNIFGGLDCN